MPSLSLPEPYYQDEYATIYHARCEDVLPELEAGGVDLVATDPPYFRVKNEAWDRAWKDSGAFLSWLGGVADEWRRVLAPNGSLYCFAGPKLSGRVDSLLSERFRILNRIRWVKENGWHKKNKREELRSYLAPYEEVIFCEQYGDRYADASKALHKDVYAPLGRYIQQERERAGLTRSELEVALGYVSRSDPTRGTALCYRWEEGSSLPTKETYERMRGVLNKCGDEYLRREYEELRREYEELRREYEELRRPFFADPDASDTWRFPTVAPYPGKHPCEKPVAMMERIVGNSSRPDALVLDCFMGSGVTLRAAANLGRKSIGIEMDERWCEKAALRLQSAPLTLETA